MSTEAPTHYKTICISMYNEDLAPARERNWGAFSIFNVWTSDVHSLWGYYLAASLLRWLIVCYYDSSRQDELIL